MGELIFGISAVAIFSLMVGLFVTMDSRTNKGIKREAAKKGFKVLKIREPIIADGIPPFVSKIDYFSKDLTLHSVSMFYFIVTVKNGERQEEYWTRMSGWSSITLKVEWIKVEV